MWPKTIKEFRELHDPANTLLIGRGIDYLRTSHAGSNEVQYVGGFYPGCTSDIPEEMKPKDNESIRWYLRRALRKAPHVVDWVQKHYMTSLGRGSTRRTMCANWGDIARRNFEIRLVAYLVDWYFLEVGRGCVEEEEE